MLLPLGHDTGWPVLLLIKRRIVSQRVQYPLHHEPNASLVKDTWHGMDDYSKPGKKHAISPGGRWRKRDASLVIYRVHVSCSLAFSVMMSEMVASPIWSNVPRA